MSVNPIPEHQQQLIPNVPIFQKSCAEAIDWYKKVFGAEEIGRMPGPDGVIPHAEIKIGDTTVYLHDARPAASMPGLPEPAPARLMLYIADVDAQAAKAVAEGAQQIMPTADMFWGDRMAVCVDPFGHVWTLASRIEILTHEQMIERMATMHAPQ